MDVGKKISELRHQLGLSQDALAEKLGVSRQSISKWESGNVLPDSDKIIALSEIFNVSTDYLLKGIEPTPAAESEDEFKPVRKFNWNIKKTIAVIVAACILISATGIWAAFKYLKEEPVKYPYVLVHGLGGWGEESGINEMLPYWGASTGNLKDYLTGQGYSVAEASVGPFSSCWDRACELYAQLAGTTVDYGEAHSKEHNHERFGRTYKTPIIENWGGKTPGGQLIKVNLVGHSFGGPTVRLLAHLLEYGAEEEINATKGETSPLFTGKKGDLVNSVTALCSPNDGSSLVYVLDDYNLSNILLKACLAFAGIAGNSSINGFLDFHLEQFGITQVPGNATNLSEMEASLLNIFKTGTDNALFDLSPEGAAKLNERIELVDNVYYFSYAYSSTEESSLTGKQIPLSSTLAILKSTALLMGRYTNTSATVKIDETWLENDGLVNVVSAKHPSDEEFVEYNSKNELKPGIWNVMPTKEGHHGTVIGLTDGVASDNFKNSTHQFYIDLITMIDSIKRDNKLYFRPLFSKKSDSKDENPTEK